MLTIDLATATEAWINRSLAEMDPDNVVPAHAYVLLLLGDLLELDLNRMRETLEKMMPQDDRPNRAMNAEREQILNDAVHQMKEWQIKNRDAAVAAITRKNELQAEVARLQRELLNSEREAADALRSGDRELAKAKLQLRAIVAAKLDEKRANLIAATDAVDDIKQQIRQSEEQVQEQVAKARAKANLEAAYAASGRIRMLYRIYLGRLWGNCADKSSESSERPQEETMRIDLDLPEEAEETIRAEAQQRGLAPQDYIARIIDGIANLADLITPQTTLAQNEPNETYHETAEDVVAQAIHEFKESQIHNRERAVKVITQQNNLKAEIEKGRRIIAELERKSIKARSAGNRGLALAFYKEKMMQERTLETMLPLLAEATEFAEQVKAELRREEEHIRLRVAEAILFRMSLKTQAYAFRYDRGPTTTDPRDVEADFERWAADYEAEEQARGAVFATRSEDVETTLNRLETMLKQKPDPKDGR
jgi:phage shock protein A